LDFGKIIWITFIFKTLIQIKHRVLIYVLKRNIILVYKEYHLIYLDVVIETDTQIYAIESKFTEILEQENNPFSSSYNASKLKYAEPFIFKLIEYYCNKKTYFPAGQLIKHYLGLLNTCPNKELVLCLAYWLPKNYESVEVYKKFFKELEEFQSKFKSKKVEFIHLNYFQIWDELEKLDKNHIKKVRDKYTVELNV